MSRTSLSTRPGAFSDGAPLSPPTSTSVPFDAPEGSLILRAEKVASRVRRTEGPRGIAARSQVWVRHVGYFLTLILCVGAAHWSFQAIPAWRHGGEMLLYAVTAILLIAVIGSVLYAEARGEIQKSARHYAFGIVALPGASLSLFMRVVSQALSGSGGDDMFVSILKGNGLPLMYVTLVVIPVFVFAKYIFGGVRTSNRSGLADEEFLATYLRQDGGQR